MRLTLTKKQKDQLLDSIRKQTPDLMTEVKKLESKVPGITKAIKGQLSSIQQQLHSDQAYEFSVKSQWANILSEITYAKQGLYSRVEGSAWYYA